MNALIRSAIVVVFVAPLAVCLIGLRFACDLTDFQRLMRAERLNDEYRQLLRTSCLRLQNKREVVRQVIAQRCRLKEAIARFQELDREWADYIAEFSKTSGRNFSDREQYHQYIIEVTKGLLGERSEETDAVLRRLEKEYQQLRADRQTPSAAPRERTKRSA